LRLKVWDIRKYAHCPRRFWLDKKTKIKENSDYSIGRRYRRIDEIGVPLAITCDFETLKKDDVTIRDRDTMEQKRVKIKDLIEVLKEKLSS